MKQIAQTFTMVLSGLVALAGCANPAPSITITYDDSLGSDGFDGRLLVLIGTDAEREPRFQINDSDQTGIVFGVDVEGWMPGETISIDPTTFAYPVGSVADIPAGEYTIQALLHKYETFNLSTGHTVKLPMDQGEGQHWNISPKNIDNLSEALDVAQRYCEEHGYDHENLTRAENMFAEIAFANWHTIPDSWVLTVK